MEIEVLVLSTPQLRLYLEWALDRENPAYNAFIIFRLKGPLNINKLSNALQCFVDYNDSHRSYIAENPLNGQIFQSILPSVLVNLIIHDLSEFPLEEAVARKNILFEKELSKPFNILKPPLFRYTLIIIEKDSYYLILNHHHLIYDARSADIMLDFVSRYYNSNVRLELINNDRFSRYLEYEQENKRSLHYQDGINYWSHLLTKASLKVNFPRAITSSVVSAHNSNRIHFELTEELTREIKLFIRKKGYSVFIVLLTGFRILLYEYTRQSDMVIGYPVNIRSNLFSNLTGFIVNNLPMRIEINGDETINSILEFIKESRKKAKKYQDISLLDIIKACANTLISAERSFNVYISPSNFLVDAFKLNSLEVTPVMGCSGSTYADFSLFYDINRTLQIEIEYDTAIFSVEEVNLLFSRLTALLKLIIDAPSLKINEINAFQNNEKTVLGFGEKVELPFDKTVVDFFDENVKRMPDVAAVKYNRATLTYQELGELSEKLAKKLLTLLGVENKVVAVYMERSLELVITIMAIFKAGKIFLPISTDFPEERIKFIIQDSDCILLIFQKESKKISENVSCISLSYDSLVNGYEQDITDLNCCKPVPSDKVYLLYTSGSTGSPKGVLIRHDSLLNRILWMRDFLNLRPANDKILQKTPYTFDVAMWEFILPLVSGVTLILAVPNGHKDPHYLTNLIIDEEINIIHFVPPMLENFLKSANVTECHSLKYVITSGEALSYQMQKQFFELLNCQLINLYGPTEATIDVTYWQCRNDYPIKIVPIGKPIWNTRCYVLDEFLNQVPVGMIGELYLGGVGIADGYLNRLDLTEKAFITNPFNLCEKIYRTGDMVRWLVDGNLEFLGRRDDQIKIRGIRIELGEIENCIGKFKNIQQCLVSVNKLEKDWQIIAYLIWKQDLNVTEDIDSLINYLKKYLPHDLLPVGYVTLKSFPTTAHGKIDRAALSKLSINYFAQQKNKISPRNLIEVEMTKIWAELLHLSEDEFSIHDNFFQVGGHSLLAIQLINRLNHLYQQVVPLSKIFENPTICGLAELFKQSSQAEKGGGKQEWGPIERRQIPLSFSQQRLWFLWKLLNHQPVYNIPLLYRIKGELNLSLLERAFNTLISRHEMLRTIFLDKHGSAIAHTFSHYTLELRSTIFQGSETEFNQEILAAARCDFDLQKLPLFKVTLFQLKDNDYVLLIVFHHIIIDMWSLNIFNRELSFLYNSFLKSHFLPNLAFKYSDFAIYQHKLIEKGKLQQQIQYWENQLKEIPYCTFPTDYARPLEQSYNGVYIPFSISNDLTDLLNNFAQSIQVTPYNIFLSVFALLLSMYTNQQEVVIGCLTAGREHMNVEDTIGFFVNTLVLRLDTTLNVSFENFLYYVKNKILMAYENQSIPFDYLVRKLVKTNSRSHHPLFQVAFSMQEITCPLQLDNFNISCEYVHTATAKFDLTLFIEKKAGNFIGSVEYCAAIFKEATIHRIIAHFQQLLYLVLSEPKQLIFNNPLLTLEEEKRLFLMNRAKVKLHNYHYLHQPFEEVCKIQPNKMAIIDNEISLTYIDLNRKSDLLALKIKQGNYQQKIIAVLLPKGYLQVIAVLGILKSGNIYLPLSIDDPAFRTEGLLSQAQASLLLTTKELVGNFSFIQSLDINQLANVHLVDYPLSENQGSPEDLAYIIFTSGSTGNSKGVMISHAAALNTIIDINHRFKFDNHDKILALSALNFDLSVYDIFGILAAGGSIIFPEKACERDPGSWLKLMHQYEVTVWNTVPAFMVMLIEYLANNKLNINHLLSKIPLRLALLSGDWIPLHLPKKMKINFPHAAIISLGGATEASIWSIYYIIEEVNVEWPSIPYGYPLTNQAIYILNPHGQHCPFHVTGEICISGEGLAKGYFNNPSLTEESFIFHPTLQERLYKTGDLGFYGTDGAIRFVGRKDFQVKINGFRVELGEIEAKIKEAAGINSVLVTVDEANNLVAYIVKSAAHFDKRQVHSYLMSSLPAYMLPKVYKILTQWPLSANGKIDRKNLPKLESYDYIDNQEDRPLIGQIESDLAKIWGHLLSSEVVNRYANFFNLGGNSILAIKLLFEIEKMFKISLSVRDVFNNPVLSALAERITSLKQETRQVITL